MLSGTEVDALLRAGYVSLAMNQSGWCYPAYHGVHPSSPYCRAYVGMDLQPGMAIFSGSSPDVPVADADHVHPQVAQDIAGRIHLLSLMLLPDAARSLLFYSRGTPLFDNDGLGIAVAWDTLDMADCSLVDTADGFRHGVAASHVSLRVARAWARASGAVVDLWLQLSADGGLNWLPAFNLTQFIPPDSDCFAATFNALCCDRDTLRPGSDLSLLFDSADQLHVAFTTVAYSHFPSATGRVGAQPTKAIIWHWSETAEAFSTIAACWIEDSLLSVDQPLLTGHTIIERPSLALDRTTGDLYCSYVRYDTSAWSQYGFLNGDVFVSVSTDNGVTWAEGTNVTRTRPAVIPAPSGQNLNEQDATLADHVSANRLHLFYLLDRSGFDTELPALNSMLYRRVPADSIAPSPMVPLRPFHVSVVPCDTIAFAEPVRAAARELILANPYPNPLNDRTILTFELPERSPVTLAIFDVLGREVQTVLNESREAGAHSISWTPRGLGSGLYFVRLETAFGTRLQKVAYLR